MISKTCALAQYMKGQIESCPDLELLAPVQLNIVCFRYRCADPNPVNAAIVVDLQESGSPRRRPPCSTARSPFEQPLSIIVRRPAMSMLCWRQRPSSVARGLLSADRFKVGAWRS